MRFIWAVIGLTALGLGLLGVALPLLPTTPFLLVAAFAFARSSPRLSAWLNGHRTFGPLIENWQTHGSINRRAKKVAAITMLLTFLLSVAFGAPQHVLIIQAVVLSLSALFVLPRPHGPEG